MKKVLDLNTSLKVVNGQLFQMLKCEKEWFEQAALIEAKWLADGVDSVTYYC